MVSELSNFPVALSYSLNSFRIEDLVRDMNSGKSQGCGRPRATEAGAPMFF